ncbi:MAG: hypothetical protein HFJ50_02090 [Clostridia bacterium]|jgi:hypothetical protein|nr:hypothetical protein [Clostridia bacterium]
MFRTTGRFIILPYYLIFFSSICIVNKRLNKFKANVVITLCLLVQFADIYPAMLNKIEYRKHEYEYNEELWSKILEDTNHIIYLSNPYYSKDDTYKIASIASGNGCTLNDFYFARKVNGVEEKTNDQLANLNNAELEEDYIYIIREEDLKEAENPNFYYYSLDRIYNNNR